MDAGRLEQQVASVDRGIAFLKQEHLAMLTGLQVEITHLKRRCHGECTQSKPLRVSVKRLSVTHWSDFVFSPSPSVLLFLLRWSVLSCELDSRFPDRNTEGKADVHAHQCHYTELHNSRTNVTQSHLSSYVQ